jgi:hypothetical protein
MPRRVRLFFINCPKLAVDATAHLLLAQNKVQSVLQFELYHFWISANETCPPTADTADLKFRARIDLSAAPVFAQTLQHQQWYIPVKATLDRHDKWLHEGGYNPYDCVPAPSIIITETPLAGGYLSFCQNDVAVISVAQWDENYAPPSAAEFVLSSVQRVALRLCFGRMIGSHYPTRGCIWDFNVHQPDARIGLSLGWLCRTCMMQLKTQASDSEIAEIEKLLIGDWIGRKNDPGSVSSTLAHLYSFDLARTKGLSPGFWSFLPQTAISELTKAAIDVAKWVAILLLTVFVASHFPNIAQFLKR